MIRSLGKWLLFVLPLMTLAAFAQPEGRLVKLEWKERIGVIHPFPAKEVKVISLRDGLNEPGERFAPLWHDHFKLPGGVVNLKATISNAVFTEMPAELAGQLTYPLTPDTSLNLESQVVIERGVSYADMRLIPLVSKAGKIFRLESFTLVTVFIFEDTGKELKSTAYAAGSVLASGKWYKVKLKEAGIYRVTYDELKAMGVDMTAVRPENIRVYGNGGAMLPEANSIPRTDDLAENPIRVVTATPGTFAPGDYFIFYAPGPHTTVFNASKKFEHRQHLYSDYAYYFFNFDRGAGKRISAQPQAAAAPDFTSTSYLDLQWYENDIYNLIRSGKQWVGERLSASVPQADLPVFDFTDYDAGQQAWLRSRLVARSALASSFNIMVNNVAVSTVNVSAFNNYDFAMAAIDLKSFLVSKAENRVTVKYNPSGSSSTGWIDWVELNVPRKLIYRGGQMIFADPNSVWIDRITDFSIEALQQGMNVWEVTDPLDVKQVETSTQGNTVHFVLKTDSLRRFIAWNNTALKQVHFVGPVTSQDLHAATGVEFLIVTPQVFAEQANRLADFHRLQDGLNVLVATNEQVYNEFSSGAPDICAIRDFTRMLYAKEDPGKLRFLLLFGDGSYDYKDHIPQNTNMVLTFETNESLNEITSYASDDFFGLLDPGEGYDAQGALDIGIGRFPVATAEQAVLAVDKCINYRSKVPDVLGDWRNSICLIADDEDSNIHFNQADELVAPMIAERYPVANINKIYLDAFTQISTPAGKRYPEVNARISEQMGKGALIVNYTGHGGEIGWAEESILSVREINEWENDSRLPVFMTATCEFSRFDDPVRVSAGEYVFLNPAGGGLALFTTTRLANAGNNVELTVDFYDTLFNEKNGNFPRFGEVIAYAKNQNSSPHYIRNFVLLGDPAMQLAFPKYEVVTTTINGQPAGSLSDTVRAMSAVTIDGFISDLNGQVASSFQGEVDVKIYDKPREVTTLANDPSESYRSGFMVQESILYKGKATVTNGTFSISFIVPRDIDYNFGHGKISYYAHSQSTDAAGFFEGLVIGGTNEGQVTDTRGPEVTLYMENEDFKEGGIVSENPLLIAYLSDESGINTVGNGIGHDIVATLDSNLVTAVVLNNFYRSDLDSYKSGVVLYRYQSLAEGQHSLKLKAWDVFNNSSEKTITFTVKNGLPIRIDNVRAYPNPFAEDVRIDFEQDFYDKVLRTYVDIVSLNGQLVRVLGPFDLRSEGNHAGPVTWDGRDDYGNTVAAGFYVASVRASTGSSSGKGSVKIIRSPAPR